MHTRMKVEDTVKKHTDMLKVIVIGGGASGLMSAIVAARNGNTVTVIEGCAKPAKKLYATGNGRCNFTNLNFTSDSFRGTNTDFAYRAYEQFNNLHLIDFMEELGVLHKEINGYVYPNSEQASSVVEVMLTELKRLSVSIITDEKIMDVQRKGNGFLCVGKSRSYEAAKVIIAVGGLASPAHGSDGSLYPACKRMGHTFIPCLPALVNLRYKDRELSKLTGVRAKCKAYLYINDLPAYAEAGEIIINKENISGIPIMQLSRFCGYALKDGNKCSVHIDFFDEYAEDELVEIIRTRLYGVYSKGKTVYETLAGFLNGKILDFLIKRASVNPNKKAAQVKPSELNAIVAQFKNFEIHITETGTFEAAQVTAGGINADEVKDSMESKIIHGLYFAGEILDIDGACGGYNLQWAFTSGYIAGQLK